MGSPCEPLTGRQVLIAELEGLGYDTMPGVRKDWPNWRTLSESELRTIVGNLRAEIAPDLGEKAAEPAEDFPDIGELVTVIRALIEAHDRLADAMLAARDLLQSVDRATAAAFPSTEVSA